MNKKADKNVKQLNLKDSPEYNITYSIITGDNASNSSDWADGECLESLAFEVSKLKIKIKNKISTLHDKMSSQSFIR